MRIAYIISAYQYPEQLIRLIHRLHTDTTSLFVHIDKKTDFDMYSQVVRGTRDLPNVHFLKRYRCYWGGFGHVQATLEGIHEIFKKRIVFDYVILLTGQDYPIKSNDTIHGFLQENRNWSFMDSFPLPSEQWQYGGLNRIERWHFRILNRRFVFPKKRNSSLKRRFPKGVKPFGGSSYWCLTRECIEYIEEHVQKNPKFVNFFRYVDVPDELFFQTILQNSPLKEMIINDDLRYIEWKDQASGSPSILEKVDLEKMLKSPKLFARKFDSLEVLDLIDRAIAS